MTGFPLKPLQILGLEIESELQTLTDRNSIGVESRGTKAKRWEWQLYRIMMNAVGKQLRSTKVTHSLISLDTMI